MSGRAASRLALGLWALSLVIIAATGTLIVLDGLSLTQLAGEGAYLNDLLVAFTFPAVAALIVSSQPGNAVGWIFAGTGLTVALTGFAGTYATYGLDVDPGSLPGPRWGAWFSTWAWVPVFGSILTFLLLLFPDGRLPSPRWRPVARLAAASIASATIGLALYPQGIEGDFDTVVENPLGISAARTVLLVVGVTGGVLTLACMVACVVALLLRLRRARGAEREQLKWFAYAAVVLAGLVLGTVNVPSGVLLGVLQALVIGPGLALAVAVAVLRHNLYDIDVVINRTLVYGLLSALLAGTYLGLVLLLQLLLNPLTSDNALAVAGSTLAVAALFRPARRRIQAAVDRRFYRRRYDAARTLAGFSARLREEIDLETLDAELRFVVREAMQPASVSVWLREESP